jgi:spermidine synthase
MRRLGTHWLARAAGCDTQVLGDSTAVARILRELPDALGLTRVGEPVVHARPEGGVAGVVLLSESHASLHASPADGTLFADVFSCAPFDPAVAEQVLRAAFRPSQLETEVVDRGPVAPTAGLQERADGRLIVVDDTHPDRRALDLEVHEVLFDGQSEHQHVLVVDTPALGRVLYLDGVLQSAERDEAAYHRALVQPALAAFPGARRVLIAGGGEGAVAREVLRHESVETTRMVDVDRVVVDVCASHLPALGAWDDPRLQVVHADFLAVVDQERDGWDVVLLDLVDQPLDQALEALPRVVAALARHGVLALCLGPDSSAADARFARVREHCAEATRYTSWSESHAATLAFAVSRPPCVPLAFTPDTWDSLRWQA